MIDLGIYEIQQNEDGKFVLFEQLRGAEYIFDDIDGLVEYIRTDLKKTEASL